MEATLDQTTPTPPVETPAAAPATSEPSSTPAVSERPQTVTELASLMAKLDGNPGATEKPTKPVTSAPAATAQGQPVTEPGSTSAPAKDAAGPIPLTVHQTALTNARAKERATVLAEVDREIGWARQIPKENLQRWGAMADRVNTDAVAFAHEILAEAAQDPRYAAQLRSAAGRTLATGRDGGLEADVEVHDANGRVIGKTYSAETVARREAALAAQIEEKILRTVQPLRAAHDRAENEAKSAEVQKEINGQADVIFNRIDAILDGRKDLYAEVNSLMTAGLDAYDAAIQVRASRIVPGQTASATTAAVDTFKKKAAGNTANGAQTAVAATARPRTEKDLANLLREMDSRNR